VELGTEGDSFFVAFPSAPEAVAAAAQAQLALAQHVWPGRESVKVRMGLHTGSPQVHEDGYVGMDVHRAARIAAAAHGGQVVLSEATTKLVMDALGDGNTVRDLGSHQLKDIPHAERIFQLVVNGLPADFPPLKTLGGASSLPRPAAPLVGRQQHLAHLTAMMSSDEVRLVTLTGPGGSGKTRLAVALAHQLARRFHDGAFFTDLSDVTTPDVMWTTLAESWGLPPEDRSAARLLSQMAERDALVVLDNLEQVVGADAVVEELLDHARQLVLLTTSRRPLHLPAEHEHPVPPLELPHGVHGKAVSECESVQLFLQQARRVHPSFALTETNAEDVAALCRGLDGLPLAIELAAARSKLLSPRALVKRLDQALDIPASWGARPARQQTLRDTIAWSVGILPVQPQALFRWLGVFSGGADLAAVTAVCADLLEERDALDPLFQLVDASLLTVTEAAEGEPRFRLLSTVRAFAHDGLAASGALDGAQRRHAEYFATQAENYATVQFGPSAHTCRQRLETDMDNLREALNWALQPDRPAVPDPERAILGRRLCRSLSYFWGNGGYLEEGHRWLARAVALPASGEDAALLAHNMAFLAYIDGVLGDYAASSATAESSVALSRPLGDSHELVYGLIALAWAHIGLGDTLAGQEVLSEQAAIARRLDDPALTALSLTHRAAAEITYGDALKALDLCNETKAAWERVGDQLHTVQAEANVIAALTMLRAYQEATRRAYDLLEQAIATAHEGVLGVIAVNLAEALQAFGQPAAAVRLIATATAARERLGEKLMAAEEESVREVLSRCRDDMGPSAYEKHFQAGYAADLETVLRHVADEGTPNAGGTRL
jgi:predicted ATPase